MGYYMNWDKRSPIIPQALKWYTVDNMIEYLHSMRRRIMEKRQQVCLILETSTAPITRDTRYPADKAYVCEGIGSWNIHLDLLLVSQSILDKQKRLDESDFTSMGKVELFALDKINQLLQSLSHVDNLVTQERFETMYGLEWSEKDPWFILFAWLDGNRMIPVVVTGFLHRVDKFWQHVAR